MSSVLSSYETRKKERHPSKSSSSAESLEVRGRSSSRKEVRGRSKSKSGFRNLKRNQCALFKELGHWKVDCPKAKGKKVESNTEANLAQADGSDEDSSVFSLSVTTPPPVDYSDNAEWILYTGATYHVCPNRAWLSSFEKLDECYTVMGDYHPCNI